MDALKGLCISNLYIIAKSPSKEVASICTLTTNGWRASMRLFRSAHGDLEECLGGLAALLPRAGGSQSGSRLATWAKLLREVGGLDLELVWCHLEPGWWRNSLDHSHVLTCGHGMLMSRALC